MPPVTTDRGHKRYRDDQLIVATPHFGAVEAALDGFGVVRQHIDECTDLGLTQLLLPALAVNIGSLRSGQHPTGLGQAPGGQASPIGAIDDLDLLLAHLRAGFAYRCGGWTPTIGKNRFVDSTEIFGEIGGGGHQIGPEGEIGGDGHR